MCYWRPHTSSAAEEKPANTGNVPRLSVALFESTDSIIMIYHGLQREEPRTAPLSCREIPRRSRPERRCRSRLPANLRSWSRRRRTPRPSCVQDAGTDPCVEPDCVPDLPQRMRGCSAVRRTAPMGPHGLRGATPAEGESCSTVGRINGVMRRNTPLQRPIAWFGGCECAH